MPRRFRNTNRLEELGRVDAERGSTQRGKTNLREEKERIERELNRPTKEAGGSVGGTRKPKRAGPSAPSPRKKVKTYGGGPDSGNIGKMKDAISKFKEARKKDKGFGRSPKSSLDDLRKKFKRREKGKMIPLRKGGSAKGPNRPRPTGPHMWVRGDKRKKYAAGKIVQGAVSGVKKILSGLGKEIKKQPLPKKTKDLNKKFKKAFPHHDSKGKPRVKKRGGGLSQTQQHYVQHGYGPYKSSGKVLKGKKIGIQIK